MIRRICLVFLNAILINIAFLISFMIRYGLPFPEGNFLPYKSSLPFLTLIYVGTFAVFGVYRNRFKSSWDLFQRVFLSVFLSTLLGVAFLYIFRARWGAFPTSVLAISFFINLLLVFKLTQLILKANRKIRKKVVIIGQGDVDDIVTKKADTERKGIDEIDELVGCRDVDEIVVTEKIQNEKDLNLLIYFVQKLGIDVVFSPSLYMKLLLERINGKGSFRFLGTFIGKKPDVEEFMIRSLDLIGSVLVLLISMPAMILVSLLIKISSHGPVLYKQQRVGKDGKIFTLYKFRTMMKDAEKIVGPVWAKKDDPRVTKIGKVLRTTRLDELPQLFNVLRGDMGLVGPRPERPHFVKRHKALRELRLAVKPGLTGLAQIRKFYDLKPQHKIRYDYLYIQRRSLLLNLYILAKTIPVLFSKKGW